MTFVVYCIVEHGRCVGIVLGSCGFDEEAYIRVRVVALLGSQYL